MGYTFSLCKTHTFIIPYNQRNGKEGIRMVQNRVRIVDVADALGLSTATVSKVIHGKTEKISDETVKVSSRNWKTPDTSQIWQAFCLQEIIQESSGWW